MVPLHILCIVPEYTNIPNRQGRSSAVPYGCFLPDLTRFGTWRRPSPFEILKQRKRVYPSHNSQDRTTRQQDCYFKVKFLTTPLISAMEYKLPHAHITPSCGTKATAFAIPSSIVCASYTFTVNKRSATTCSISCANA